MFFKPTRPRKPEPAATALDSALTRLNQPGGGAPVQAAPIQAAPVQAKGFLAPIQFQGRGLQSAQSAPAAEARNFLPNSTVLNPNSDVPAFQRPQGIGRKLAAFARNGGLEKVAKGFELAGAAVGDIGDGFSGEQGGRLQALNQRQRQEEDEKRRLQALSAPGLQSSLPPELKQLAGIYREAGDFGSLGKLFEFAAQEGYSTRRQNETYQRTKADEDATYNQRQQMELAGRLAELRERSSLEANAPLTAAQRADLELRRSALRHDELRRDADAKLSPVQALTLGRQTFDQLGQTNQADIATVRNLSQFRKYVDEVATGQKPRDASFDSALANSVILQLNKGGGTLSDSDRAALTNAGLPADLQSLGKYITGNARYSDAQLGAFERILKSNYDSAVGNLDAGIEAQRSQIADSGLDPTAILGKNPYAGLGFSKDAVYRSKLQNMTEAQILEAAIKEQNRRRPPASDPAQRQKSDPVRKPAERGYFPYSGN